MTQEQLAKATAHAATLLHERVPTPYTAESAAYIIARLVALDWFAHADPDHPLSAAALRLSWAWWRHQLDAPEAEAHLVPNLVLLSRLHPPPRQIAPYLHALRVRADAPRELALLATLHDALSAPPTTALPHAAHQRLTDALRARFRSADDRRALLILAPTLTDPTLRARVERLDTWLLRHDT